MHIATITATASLETKVYLDRLYGNIVGIFPLSVVYARFKGNFRGCHPNAKHRETVRVKRRTFDNHVTLVLANGTNIKVFGCGSVQMTGVKDISSGQCSVEQLAETLNFIRCCDGCARISKSLQVHLINCNFKLENTVNRTRLHQALHSIHPNIRASFEPCIYPGVRIELYNGVDGVCCTCNDRQHNKCIRCEKTTIMVFSSGSVLIAGAKSLAAVERARTFITSFIQHSAKDPPVVS